jgi:Mrp family chromosome partitioning ATPase
VRGSARTDQPTRLLGPDGLGALLAAVRPSLDLILIDSSPLAAVADARLIAKLADQVLLLVRHVTTPGTVCAQALQALMDSEASVAGIVLSRVDLGALALAGDGEGRLAQASLRAYYAD